MRFPTLRLRYGLRKLVHEPSLTVIALLVLALGIGVNTLMFMILDHLVLRPVPFSGLDHLVAVWETDLRQGVAKGAVSSPDFLDWQARSRSFDSLAAILRSPMSLRTGHGETEQVQGARVTGEFFHLLGVTAALGNLPRSRDGSEDVAVISHSLWQRNFGSNPGIVGHTVEIDGRPFTVLGVLKAGEDFPRRIDLWLPVRLRPEPGERGRRSLLVIGRLAAATDLRRVRLEMQDIAAQLQREFPATNAQTGAMVGSLRDEFVGNNRATISLVFGALALSLIIVCVNLANMLLVRAAARHKEFAVGVALGARRSDIVGQLLGEVFLLVLSGTILAFGVALVGRALLAASLLGRVAQADALTLDLRALAFALCVAGLTGFLMAMAPVLHYLGSGLNALTAETGSWSRGHGMRVLLLQRLLVVLQMAVSLPLILCTLLLLQNRQQIRQLDLGFQADGTHVLRVSFSRNGPPPSRRVQIVQEGLDRVRALPGIDAVGLVSDLPFSGSRTSGQFVIVGRPALRSIDAPVSDLRVAAGEYFRSLAIPLKRGRAFTSSDDRFAPGVAIINESLAQRYWPGEDPLGKRIRVGSPEEVALAGGSIEREIVGIVGDVIPEGLGKERRPELYLPYGQSPTASASLVFRTRRQDPAELAASVSSAFAGGSTDAAVSGYLPMAEIVSRSLGYPEVQAGVVAFLGLLSLGLSGMSIYAIIAHFLRQRRQSLAVRMALGAQRADILKLVIRQGMILCLGGLAVGAFSAAVVLRLLEHQIHLLHPQAWPAVLLSLAILAALAFVSALVPAQRILRLEPGSLLRYE
jgi:predicted permease